jgi:hypothetical protein
MHPFRAGDLITFFQDQLWLGYMPAAGAYLRTVFRGRLPLDGVRAADMQPGHGGASACNERRGWP